MLMVVLLEKAIMSVVLISYPGAMMAPRSPLAASTKIHVGISGSKYDSVVDSLKYFLIVSNSFSCLSVHWNNTFFFCRLRMFSVNLENSGTNFE